MSFVFQSYPHAAGEPGPVRIFGVKLRPERMRGLSSQKSARVANQVGEQGFVVSERGRRWSRGTPESNHGGTHYIPGVERK